MSMFETRINGVAFRGKARNRNAFFNTVKLIFGSVAYLCHIEEL